MLLCYPYHNFLLLIVHRYGQEASKRCRWSYLGQQRDVEEEDKYGKDDDQDNGYGEQMGMWRVRGGYDLLCILRNKSGIQWYYGK